MLKLPVLKFVNEACLHSPPHEQSSFTFYTNTIPQQRYLLMQRSTTSRWIILIHIVCSSGRSGWQEVNREISTITGVSSVRSRWVNGLYIQDMDNLLIVFFVSNVRIFTKESNSQPTRHCNTRKPRSLKHLERITLCIHHQPDEEIVLLIGLNIPYALQRSLRQRKRTLEYKGYVQLDR